MSCIDCAQTGLTSSNIWIPAVLGWTGSIYTSAWDRTFLCWAARSASSLGSILNAPRLFLDGSGRNLACAIQRLPAPNPRRPVPTCWPIGRTNWHRPNNAVQTKGSKFMLIGSMNNPRHPLAEQIQWLGKMGFDFLDLTLEPPHAASWKIDAHALKKLLIDANLRVVGHTAPFLPIASPVEELRQAALAE